jgi:polysaccharide export outer membrane protein
MGMNRPKWSTFTPRLKTARARLIAPTKVARAALLCGWLLSGCVTPAEPPRGAAARASRLEPSSRGGYVLEPGDEIEVTFLRTPELNVRQIIRPDGSISLAGGQGALQTDVQAANLTVQQLRAEMARIYSSELKNPDIAVMVRTFGSNVVYVTGEVGHPGAVPLNGSMSALQAVLAAEGFKSSACATDVLVIRKSGQTRASWQIVNLKKSFGAPGASDDVALAPHDIIYVPRSPIGNVDEVVDLYIRKVLPVEPGVQVPVS